MNSATKKYATALILLANTAFAATNVMAATPSPATATPTASVKPVLSQEQKQIQKATIQAQSGREALSYIVAARKLLSEQHSEEASQYLEKAKGLLLKLKSEIPANIESTNALLPIYSQMGVKEGVEVTDEIKQQLRKTHLDAIRGNHKKVVEALKAVDIEMQYSFVDLPVVATLDKVESALKLLPENDPKEAGKILSDAEAGLVQDSIIVNSVSENPAS